MSFQGDVAGLGLGELLQGLARGGREGVLTLRGGTTAARIGVLEGQLYLLPLEDEDGELWRRRCERAWVKDPDQRIDALRMREIAYASRLETMFQLLDSEGVHFRFEPGPLPDPAQRPSAAATPEAEQPLARMETGATLDVQTQVHCPAISVEFLLLEHARLQDELSGHPDAAGIHESMVVRTLGVAAPHKSFERLWTECDGMSNVREISDRLGWPLRQVRGLLQALFAQDLLRFADAREMLVLAQRELQAGRLARAATRLSGWCRLAPAGAPSAGDAQMILAEWEKGKLPAALASVPAADARTLLRRLDLADPEPSAAVARWNELRKHHKHDPVCELRALHWQHRSPNEADAPSMPEMLRVARKFQDIGHPWRAGLVLRAAASRGPDTTAVRLEIGQRLVACGFLDDGASWVVDACRALIEAAAADKAIAPLRQLLAIAPAHRDAKALLAVAHGKTVTGKRTRRNSVAVLASVLVLALAAVIKLRFDSDLERKLGEVREQIDEPETALRTLDSNFGGGGPDEVEQLRAELVARIDERATAARNQWIERFQACQLECIGGDPVLGLKNALELPPPPRAAAAAHEPLPTLAILLDGLIEKLQQTLAAWDTPDVDSPEIVHTEQRLANLIEALRVVAQDAPAGVDLADFRGKLESLALVLRDRDSRRAAAREKRMRDESYEQQDVLLSAARAHSLAGDLARAVESYEKLAQVDGSQKVMAILAVEIAGVRAHYDALLQARRLAETGRHADALERLATVCPRPSEHLLPCRIESHPQGARVRFSDGSSRVTPFVLEAAPGERMRLEFALEGFETAQLDVDSPADRLVLLSRVPDVAWSSPSRVEALPVSVDNDHVVCDRAGRIARIDRAGRVQWSASLDSLGGVARTPVFLAKRAGSLLAVTEEGSAWIIDCADGRLEGPWPVDSPPLAGPEPTAGGVRVRFRDGREVVWSQRLKPESEANAENAQALTPDRGHDAGLAVLRRSPNDATSLASPWGQWTVAVEPTHFVVRERGTNSIAFAVRRQAEWNYVAWEAPTARLPRGKLWLSDGVGLRAFEP